MKLVCPTCSATSSAESYAGDADARATLVLAAELPGEIGAVAIRYLGLFRPGKNALRWDRARRLLEELAPMIKAGSVTRDGREWPAPPAAWRAAMQQMLDKRGAGLELPLKSHGYLLEILKGTANRAEAAQERATEEARRDGRPAPLVDEDAQRQMHEAQVRTAVLLLNTENDLWLNRFKQALTRPDAMKLLHARGFTAAVAERACIAHFDKATQ